jgi:hypothetical protein
MVTRFTGPATAAAALGLAAGLVVAGCGNSGSGQAAGRTRGAETFTAASSNLKDLESKAPTAPVTATGAFSDTGTISLGSGKTSQLTFTDGTITVSHGTGSTSQHVAAGTCRVSYTDSHIPYQVVRGTGRFAGITGKGAATTTVSGTVPKTSAGKCDISPSVAPAAVRETFTATGQVSFRG